MSDTFDYIIVGAGSAGCAAAFRLSQLSDARIAVVEAGGSDRDVRVKIPFALVNLMGSRKDWRNMSAPLRQSGDRTIRIPRGRMLGGSSSINSMVWFRGCDGDFDAWGMPGWAARDVAGSFEAIEAHTTPQRLPHPHPLAEAFGAAFSANDPAAPPTPERESAGVFHTNMRRSRRWSAADAFLRPAQKTGRVTVITNSQTERVVFAGQKATGIRLVSGRDLTARRAVVLSAGAIQSPMILMRSGIGPGSDLHRLGIDVVRDAPEVGRNLHDHPACGLFFQGANSGYGLTLNQMHIWALAPFQFALARMGVLASNCVEAGAFFRADGSAGRPDVQTHFIPFMMGWQGRTIVRGSGYFADVCVCRPKSRGRLSLGATSHVPVIDLNLLDNGDDLDVLTAGLTRLRRILAAAPLGDRRADEAYPKVAGDALRDHIRANVSTAYHPVGTCALGTVLNADLSVKARRTCLWRMRLSCRRLPLPTPMRRR